MIFYDYLTVWLVLVPMNVLHYGLYAHGQAGFPSGTTINCYGQDSTCSSASTDTTLNYDDSGVYQFNTQTSANPCCFMEISGQALLQGANYYSVNGGICQSCRDENIFLRHLDVQSLTCYSDTACTQNPDDQNDPNSIFNGCCGYVVNAAYYIVNGGSCSPCSPSGSSTGPSGGADPHFVCPLKNKEKLCYSIQGMPEFIFNLLSDIHLQLNAKFSLPQAEESHSTLNSTTFIQQLGLIIKHPISNISTKLRISALDHSVITVDSHITVKEYPVIINIINNTVTTTVETVSANPYHDETAWVRIITDVGLGLKLRFIKKHLDYVITDSSGLTLNAHGIQGQFMGAKVIIDKHASLMKFGDSREPFVVKEGEIWPYLNIPEACWYPVNTDDQGEGVLEGVYTDYIVDDLFAINFKYNKFK